MPAFAASAAALLTLVTGPEELLADGPVGAVRRATADDPIAEA
jgi:hypothetical protein